MKCLKDERTISSEHADYFEEGIKSVLYCRCSKHLAIMQLNKNEYGGAECGACVSESFKIVIESLNQRIVDLVKQLKIAQDDVARLEWFEQACQGSVRGTSIPEWRINGETEDEDDIRKVIDREAKRLGEHRDNLANKWGDL